jgi:hypothetical protein
MDHGTLTDHNGRKVDFRNVVHHFMAYPGELNWPGNWLG